MQDARVIAYTPDLRAAWDDLVEESENGTIFHRMDFLDYHPADRFERCDVLIESQGRLVAALPLARSGHAAMSPFGASFGGPACLRLGAVRTMRVFTALREHLAGQGIRELTVALPPIPYCKRHGVGVEYALMRAFDTVAVRTTRVTSVIDLHASRGLSEGLRRNVRKALGAGVAFERAAGVNEFYGLLAATIEGRHGAKLTHSRAELAHLAANLPDKVEIFLARHEGRAVAGVCCLGNASPCAFAFYNCHDKDQAPPGALAALFEHVADEMRSRGKRYLDLGATSMLGKPCNEGLFQFKEGLGADLWYRNTHVLGLEQTP